jgi:hypothetical protein
MVEHAQGQPGPDRAVGRPGPAAKMAKQEPGRRRPNVLIAPVQPSDAPTQSSPVPPGSAGAAPGAPAQSASPPPPAPTRPARNVPGNGARPPVAPPTRPGPGPGPTSSQQGQPRVTRVVQQSGGPRSARLYLTHVDPWSVMKQAFLLSMALAVIILAASATLWIALDSAGVIDAITRTATDVGGDSAASVTSYLSLGKVMGASLVLAGIETVLVTALATLFAFLYNLAVGIGGGLEITLSEED